ncbi:ATP-binding protein of ABC transporter [Crocosphaera subtropica ATCC 51142]|uniref:ATP-binding protein of ABC transporter n=1 Tax=Crocosphaera subtropica (strain ATCC 51142 / BH68) TaxID=43989 RepID=B1WXD6_CROS5|nr:energy-coupling factor transporter ATPase [Crocosphaera subtropica]ACB50880.1 ATP-binding protein of ABC transporter [Crocosphaera subtropica ATCC 51142]
MDIIAGLDKVSYFYPNSKQPVLRDISLEIYEGEFLGLIGPTGAGKTTLCLTLNGIVPQFYGGRFFGYVTVAGLDTLKHPVSHLAGYVGAVFEDPETQLISTSVENEIAFALENLCVDRDEIIDRIPHVLEAVRLEGTENKHPQELSGGQKQRLAIAAALALQPRLLILDEPTSQLDPIGTMEVFSTVKELNKELGVTIVMVSHAAEEMAEFSDRLILLSEGEVIATGKPHEIYSEIELLERHNLRPPQVAKTFYEIKQRGLTIPKIPVTLEEGKKGLKQLQNIACISPKFDFKTIPYREDQIPVLSTENLTHTYEDGTKALYGISLNIYEGEYCLIIGQNGAGKSTLVKHFLNLLKPTKGRVRIKDKDTKILTVSDLAKSIGYVAQNPDNQIFSMTVGEEVAFALNNVGYEKEKIEKKVTQSLEDMGLLEYKKDHPLSLPKGDRARIIIAAILAMEPDIIIFDEPTTGQDYKGSRAILDVSRQLHQMGKTIIVITHHLYLMPDYTERVILMGKGTVLLDAPIRQAYHKTDLLESTYLTPPQAVLLAKTLSELKNENCLLLTPNELAECFYHDEV